MYPLVSKYVPSTSVIQNELTPELATSANCPLSSVMPTMPEKYTSSPLLYPWLGAVTTPDDAAVMSVMLTPVSSALPPSFKIRNLKLVNSSTYACSSLN